MVITNRHSVLVRLYESLYNGQIFWLLLFAVCAYIRLRKNFRSRSSGVTLLCLLLYLLVLPTAVLQIVFDVAEVRQVEQGQYWPWIIDGRKAIGL